jgi:general L-amino acid transport system substrate-binding protein
LITAEDLGITSSNADSLAKTTKNPAIKRFLGIDGTLGKNLGLDQKWSYNIVKQVGNYNETFERNVGMGSPLKISRGLNALWKNGGILYSPPFR